ncbi:MAG: 2-oxoacid:ferredoxin oxidoreductase subunit beta [Gammaproteobacteria bacterium]|nr:2-oxoacid:ferredoxin oxidoreductase subunit beta [Gammaproteobacteria bacterium]
MNDVSASAPAGKLTANDFTSDQEVRWCPGCGDYSILAQMKKALPEIGIAPERTVFVSGIGCSSRFPYYLNTYGMHTIHGRAPAIATGLKTVRPDLSVWVITGDGDALSIGGNHLLHILRRNVDVNILLFNNRIYGLTKGQYSPTSPMGLITASTPVGSLDRPLNPLVTALGAAATFLARSVDVYSKHLIATLKRAAAHQGTSFVEIYQNCNVYNDGAFGYAADRQTRPDTLLELEHGKPMVFGANNDKGIRLNGLALEVVYRTDADESELLVHDETRTDTALAHLLANMTYPNFPEPIGVLRAVSRPCYDTDVNAQVASVREQRGAGDLDSLFHAGDTWEVS